MNNQTTVAGTPVDSRTLITREGDESDDEIQMTLMETVDGTVCIMAELNGEDVYCEKLDCDSQQGFDELIKQCRDFAEQEDMRVVDQPLFPDNR